MRTEHLLALTLIACGEPSSCPGTLVTADGGTYCVVPTDAGPDASIERCADDLTGVRSRVEVAGDGRTSAVVARTPLGTTMWSSAGADLLVRDDALFWMETHDACGMQEGRTWWGLATHRFVDDGSGHATDATMTCEPETFPLTTQDALRLGSGLILTCGTGHHPSMFLSCGTIDEPGSFSEVAYVEHPRVGRLGHHGDGAVLHHQHVETGARAAILFDASGRRAGERALAGPGEPGGPAWVEAIGDELWSAYAGRVERDSLAPLTTPGVMRPPPIPFEGFEVGAAVEPAGEAMVLPDGMSFLLRELGEDVARVYLARASIDGALDARLVDVGSVPSRLARWGTGYLILVRVPDEGVRLLRVDCAGRLLEAPIAVVDGGAYAPRALAVREDVGRAWVVVSNVDATTHHHEAISLAVPPP